MSTNISHSLAPKEILQRFISVQSLVANLTSALEPFQKDAKSLLERINNGEVNTIDEIKYTIESLNKINNLFT